MRLLTSDSQRVSWRVIPQPDLAAAIFAAARDLASRLRDEACLHTAAELALQQTRFPSLLSDATHTLTGGYAGLAVLCASLDRLFPEENWDVVGHRYLQIALRALESLPGLRHRLALSAGLSGVAFATWSLSRNGTRYQRLLEKLEQQLLPQVRVFAEKVGAERTHGCTDTLYDQISGLSGMGAYLLCRREVPAVAETLNAVLTSLIYLTEESDRVPHWHIPPHLAPEDSWKNAYPDGHLNCGLAHGIPGPLALLSLARLQGVELSGINEAIGRTADWVVAHHIEDEWGVNWRTSYPVGRFAGEEYLAQGSRTAWCYGTPGVARALWLAGEVLDCAEYRELACAGMQGVYRQPLSVRNIDSPSFCHGVAGLLQITLRFANDTGDLTFFDAGRTLSEQMFSLYQPEALLGYRHQESTDIFIDHPWLLDGTAGIVLVLLAASTTSEPTWDRLFLLS